MSARDAPKNQLELGRFISCRRVYRIWVSAQLYTSHL